MKSTTKNRVIGIVLVGAMSAGLIASGISILLAQTEQDHEKTEERKTAQTEKAGKDEKEDQQASADKESRTAVTGFFKALENGDVTEAYSYTAEDMNDLFDLKGRQEEFAESVKNEPAEIQDILNDYYNYSVSQQVRDYAIEQSVQSDDKAAFLVRITGADFSKQKQLDEQPYNDQVQEYIASHMDELNRIVSEQSQEAADLFLRTMKMKSYYSDMKKGVESLPDHEIRIEITTQKQDDGTVLITGMKKSGS